MLDRHIFNLSGGEKQRIACVSVMAHQPALFLLDEPSSNLDRNSIEDLATIVYKLKEMGKTIVIAEHRFYYLMDIVDRIIRVEHGAIVGEFTPDRLKQMSKEQRDRLGLRAVEAPRLLPCQLNQPLAVLALEDYRVAIKNKTVINIERQHFYQHRVRRSSAITV